MISENNYELLIGNHNTLKVCLRDAENDSYINNADIFATLKNMNDVAITGQSWPLKIDYVFSSNGIYIATLNNTINAVNGHYYKLDIDCLSDGIAIKINLFIMAKIRRK